MNTLHVLAGIGWDPQIRGFLTVGIGVVVLLGSGVLLLATNVGIRLGFYIAGAAFWGWLMVMGAVWWAYGNTGMIGQTPKWEVTEIVYPGVAEALLPEARTLDTDPMPEPEVYNDLEAKDLDELRDQVEPELGGWKLLPESDPSYGEAKATVDEYFLAHPDNTLPIKSSADYISAYAFERGGKRTLPRDPTRMERITTRLYQTFVQLRHPTHYAILQVQPTLVQEAAPGEPPPLPKADPSKPTVSVIMERNIGDTRFPGAMLTISSGLMFAVMVTSLHRRDVLAAQRRGALPMPTEA